MKMTQNTILVTGGGSGIGRGLAEAFHRLGNQVVISGRSQKKLEETTGANPGMKSVVLDIGKFDSLKEFATQLASDYPALNVVIQCAGIMLAEDLLHPKSSLAPDESTINTNLLGPIRLTSELLPLLLRQPESTVITVSSGLAFVPMAITPTYSATKAAVHSYTQSLRYQLKDTVVKVIEIIPPYVATSLMGGAQTQDPRAMPLDAYISETMEILTTQPDETEILVKKVHLLRFAAEKGRPGYEAAFKGLNDAMTESIRAHS